MAAIPLPADFQLRDYRIRKAISRGGFGVTYLAEDLSPNAASQPWGRPDRLVAIKEYLPLQGARREDSASVVEPADDSRETTEMFSWGFDKFADEARLLARVSSKKDPADPKAPCPNFARIGPFFEENNTAYIVMEYIAGGSLRTQLDHATAMAEETLRPFLRQLLNALALVHEDGVWHRDIKPQNILFRIPKALEEPGHMLDERARNRAMPSLLDRKDVCPVLIDFGAARMRPSFEGASVSMVGTEGYAPPEQFEGRQVGPWSDIYAVSAVTYRALTGRTPTAAHQRQTTFLRTGFDPLEPIQRAARQAGSPNFLMALDWGLWIESDLRPQTLAEWRPVLLEGAPGTDVVRDQFLIGALAERGEASEAGHGGAGELPIVEDATGELGPDTQAAVTDKPVDPKPKPGPDPKPLPVKPLLVGAGALAAVIALVVVVKALAPGPKPPDGNTGGSSLDTTTASIEGTVLASETLTGSDWVKTDVSSKLSGKVPRWLSLEADAPVRVRADGVVYLVEADGVRIPDIGAGSFEVKRVNGEGGPVHFEIRAGKAAN